MVPKTFKSAVLPAALSSINGGEGHYQAPPVVQVVLNFPPVVGYEGLAQLMDRSVQTLQADRCRNPDSVPPASMLPRCRKPLWIVSEVVEFVRQHKARIDVPKAQKRVSGRGASTKAERLAAMQAGLSVREWRAAHGKNGGGHD